MEHRGGERRGKSSFVDARFETLDNTREDVWPRRMPGSARRYQGADVRADVSNFQSEEQPFALPRGSRAGEDEGFDRRSASGRLPGSTSRIYNDAYGREKSIPARRTATTMGGLQGTRRQTVRGEDVDMRDTEALEGYAGRFRPHWLVFIGAAMLVMVLGWVVFSAVANWWQVTQDDAHYGRPRTFQMDTVVGHSDSAANQSHFIAINLNRHIEVIEFPGGDPTKAKVYIGPTLIGDGQALAAVTLSFQDVNGDGRPDMVLHIQDSHFVFINENGSFRPARPDENVHL